MGLLIQIVVKSTSNAIVARLEEAFHEAGLETALHVFGDDPDRNAEVAIHLAEQQVSGAHSKQVWIVPAAFVGLERSGQQRAALGRQLIGLPRKEHPRRLLVTIEPSTGEAPEGAEVMSLDELCSLPPQKLSDIFK